MSSRESGFALPLALVVLLLVGAGLALLASAVSLRRLEVERHGHELTRGALLDATVAETLARLGQDAGFSGIGPRPVPGGNTSSRVEPRPGGRYRIEATALFRGRSRTLLILVRRENGQLEITDVRRK